MNGWKRRSTVLLLLGGLASASCAVQSVNQILVDPSRYRNQDVRVAGTVVESFSLADQGFYRLQDEAAELWVLSAHGVPRKGARVTVKGTLREGFNIGSLADRANLPPGLANGLVLMESSHKARD